MAMALDTFPGQKGREQSQYPRECGHARATPRLKMGEDYIDQVKETCHNSWPLKSISPPPCLPLPSLSLSLSLSLFQGQGGWGGVVRVILLSLLLSLCIYTYIYIYISIYLELFRITLIYVRLLRPCVGVPAFKGWLFIVT